MRIALLEMRICWEDKKTNMATLEKVLMQACKHNIDILLLPEMSFTGFSMNVEKTKENDMESINKCKELSRKYGVAIGAGWVKACDEKCENHYSIVMNDEMLCDYVKIHPFSYAQEDKYFKGGEKLDFFTFKDFTIGIQICYDLRFPETFRLLAEKADLIILPANWPQQRMNHWNILTTARAIENQVYIAAINCCGNMGQNEYAGGTKIVSPDGENVQGEVYSDDLGNKMLIYDLNSDVRKYRESFPVLQDKKSELYHKMLPDYFTKVRL